jgi:hypothetical protein
LKRLLVLTAAATVAAFLMKVRRFSPALAGWFEVEFIKYAQISVRNGAQSNRE